MNPDSIPSLLYFYGAFLIASGVVSITFIGAKAKTAVISGGISGLISITVAYLILIDLDGARLAGLLVPAGLFIVFCWRSTKTLFKIFDLIPSQHADLKGKGIAFLIISLMAIVSLFILALQITSF